MAWSLYESIVFISYRHIFFKLFSNFICSFYDGVGRIHVEKLNKVLGKKKQVIHNENGTLPPF